MIQEARLHRHNSAESQSYTSGKSFLWVKFHEARGYSILSTHRNQVRDRNIYLTRTYQHFPQKASKAE